MRKTRPQRRKTVKGDNNMKDRTFLFCFILCMATFLAKVELYLHLGPLNYPLFVIL